MITGGSRGLGRAMAQALAEAGADLILVGRDESALEAAAKEIVPLGRWVAVLPGDIGTPEGAASACDGVELEQQIRMASHLRPAKSIEGIAVFAGNDMRHTPAIPQNFRATMDLRRRRNRLASTQQ